MVQRGGADHCGGKIDGMQVDTFRQLSMQERKHRLQAPVDPERDLKG